MTRDHRINGSEQNVSEADSTRKEKIQNQKRGEKTAEHEQFVQTRKFSV